MDSTEDTVSGGIVLFYLHCKLFVTLFSIFLDNSTKKVSVLFCFFFSMA